MQAGVQTGIHITDIEAAINHWRGLIHTQNMPNVSDGIGLGPQLRALAAVYGRMIYQHQRWIAQSSIPEPAYQAWLAWYETTPDTPCIAICSTSQGDAYCKGCGRSATEVKYWIAYTPMQKRMVWQRIQTENSAWRFNRYAERA